MKHIGDSYHLNGDWLERTYRDVIHDRFLIYVAEDESGCWIWHGQVSGRYGRFAVTPPGYGLRNVAAHRWSYTYYKGEIPESLVLDHLCGVKLCVNPDHLEPVTQAENVARSAHLPRARRIRRERRSENFVGTAH